jgi:transposase
LKKSHWFSKEQEGVFEKLINAHTTAQQLVARLKIILMAAKGECPVHIASELGVARTTVYRWINRWLIGHESDIPVSEILNDDIRSGAPCFFTPEQLCQLFAMACDKPELHGLPISHWTGVDLANELMKQQIVTSISSRHVSRLLAEADIKPHLMNYYLHTKKDEIFDERTADICGLYKMAPTITAEGGRVISCDEMTGIQALERDAPDKPVAPGKIERKEFNYKRHGTVTLIANFDVGTGQVINSTIGPTRTEADFAAHINRLISASPLVNKWHIVLDNLNIHKSESLVCLIASYEGIEANTLGEKGKNGILKSQDTRQDFLTNTGHKIVFHYTPKHASWLNQIEIWFSILVRKLIKRQSFTSTENLSEKILEFIKYFNKTMAKPFKWTYKGRVLSA